MSQPPENQHPAENPYSAGNQHPAENQYPAGDQYAAAGQSPAGGQFPAGDQYAAATPPPSAPAGRQEAGFFRAMLDFRFEHFITVKFSSFIYVLAFIVAGLYWLLQIISAIAFGVALGTDVWTGETSFNAVPLVLAILFGWIPSVILLIAMRLGLEFAVATVRTSQNTSRLAEIAEAGGRTA